jgi:RNA polymerase sigma-70 factor, ECF subfamily
VRLTCQLVLFSPDGLILMGSADRTNEFVRLFTANARWVYSYIYMLVPNKADAEEIYQETNVTLWQKFDEFVPGSNFRNWAARVSHFKILQYREKQKKSPLLYSDVLLEAVHGTATKMADELDDLQWALAKCRDKLAEPDREILSQRYAAGATTQSVASRLGRSARAVYRALERIHQGLYDCIRGELAARERS